MKYEVSVADETYTIEINEKGILTLDGEEVAVDFARSGAAGLCSLLVNNESFESLVEYRDKLYHVLLRGNMYEVQVLDERDKLLSARVSEMTAAAGEINITSPMPGLVVSVPVAVGQEVIKGSNLLILESMKMENEIKAPRDAVVTQVRVQSGQSVEQNQVMLVLE